HDLVAKRPLKDFAKFNPNLRGLIEAPLFVSEVAFGRRPSPTARQKVELVQAIHADPGAFEAALPAAMAWQHAQNQE
ncbi:MAG: hypothetical protein V2I43_03310, partial [Parvularcula sp.]|nr:hypothetical protein [Parvularcula sp.]